jgi:hypothetical protein
MVSFAPSLKAGVIHLRYSIFGPIITDVFPTPQPEGWGNSFSS